MVEDNLRWKMVFGGRRPSGEDDLRRKKTFGGRQPSVEDDLRWKTTFVGGRLMEEDNLQLKITFGRRGPSEDLACCLLPNPLCGIFSQNLSLAKNKNCLNMNNFELSVL